MVIDWLGVYTEQAVFVCAVQQFVQLVERSAGGVPRQEGRLLRQVANQLQGNTLWEVPGPAGAREVRTKKGRLSFESM